MVKENIEKKFKIVRDDSLEHRFGHNTKAFVENGVIIYTSAGSSSCPPIVEKVEQIGNEIYLTTKDYSRSICTQDISPIVQIIKYADGTRILQHMKIFLDGRQQN